MTLRACHSPALQCVLAGFLAGLGCSAPSPDASYEELTFIQADQDAVDLLWVVDNSSSFMAFAQDRLATAVPRLIPALEGMDVQMAVVTTTLDKSLYPHPFTGSDTDVAWLVEELQVGSEGSDQEQGLQAAANAVAPDWGFVRPDAHLVIVFISDEEDCSNGGRLTTPVGSACYTSSDRLLPIDDFVDLFMDLHDGQLNRATAIAIGATQSSVCLGGFSQERYARVARATGGPVLDICAVDYGAHMDVIGQNAAGIRQALRLPDPAIEPSIEVRVDSKLSGSFDYRPHTWLVQFTPDAIPAEGATVRLFYQIDPTLFGIEP
ncbi:MAG: vWA domain-containing protein [Myxococcota bacterium]